MGLKKGYIQIYTGTGKGKTTAALGLALRASGAGLKVYMAQFLKKGDFSETRALKKITEITCEQFGNPGFILGNPGERDCKSAREGLASVRRALRCGDYDIVIMDEINTALDLGLLEVPAVLDLLEEKAENTELILTGRNAPEAIIEKAHLVTEMRSIKHYYNRGVSARRGIED